MATLVRRCCGIIPLYVGALFLLGSKREADLQLRTPEDYQLRGLVDTIYGGYLLGSILLLCGLVLVLAPSRRAR